ncbi:hypothetical protein ACW4TU_44785 [Streptomyces sp. QTS52]
MAMTGAVLAAIAELREDLDTGEWDPDEYERVLTVEVQAEGRASTDGCFCRQRSAVHVHFHDPVTAVQGPLTPCRDQIPRVVRIPHPEGVAVGLGIVEAAVDIVISTVFQVPDLSQSVIYAGSPVIALVALVLGMDVDS